MDERMNFKAAAPDVYKTMLGMHQYLEKCGIEGPALEWTEAVTRLTEGSVPDHVCRLVREQFNERELANLTLVQRA
jgi:hypothetical protein